MRKAYAVIGSNYGDEGKGLIVDYLCSGEEKAGTVVRFNGGAQAGHTVQRADGHRHVFHHFGAGTFAGWRTYLSKEFICNPLLFCAEGNALAWKPTVSASPLCRVTTPWDMLINQAVEDARGVRRHGSCGVGINETVERCLNHRYGTRLWQLQDERLLMSDLERIRTEWVPQRLAALGLRHDALDRYHVDRMTGAFLAARKIVCREINRVDSFRYFRDEPGPVVFEGAQGLGLDQDNRDDFPHLTRSNTGLRNVAPLLPAAGAVDLDVVYVTRAYATRHGQGPLPGEDVGLTYTGIQDPTNVRHLYQGTMRYAPICPAATRARILKDRKLVAQGSTRLAITCADHVRGDIRYLSEDGEHLMRAVDRPWDPASVAGAISKLVGFDEFLWGAGPTRASVKESTREAA